MVRFTERDHSHRRENEQEKKKEGEEEEDKRDFPEPHFNAKTLQRSLLNNVPDLCDF